MPDHVHMCLSFPPKHSMSMTVGYIKGKSAIKIYQDLTGLKNPNGSEINIERISNLWICLNSSIEFKQYTRILGN
jgi:REP element-mobilizing transposase RayT